MEPGTVTVSVMALQLVLSFGYVFIRGYQNQNMVGGRYYSAFFTSYLVSGAEVTNIMLTTQVGWWSVVPLGIGGSFGVIACMYVYRINGIRGIYKLLFRSRNKDTQGENNVTDPDSRGIRSE